MPSKVSVSLALLGALLACQTIQALKQKQQDSSGQDGRNKLWTTIKTSQQLETSPSTTISTQLSSASAAVADIQRNQPAFSPSASASSSSGLQQQSSSPSQLTAALPSKEAAAALPTANLGGYALPVPVESPLLGGVDKDGDDAINPWTMPLSFAADSSDKRDNDAAAASSDEGDDDDDDGSYFEPGEQRSPTGQASGVISSKSALQPSVILASGNDLKTAAGYHHSSSPFGYGGHGHSHYGYQPKHYGYEPKHGYGHGLSDHHGYAAGKYYQYTNVPKPYAWNSGYRRGNPYHTIERHEHADGPHFQAKVKWSDKHEGYGVHIYDLNHYPKHDYHHYGGHGHGGHGGHGSGHSKHY